MMTRFTFKLLPVAMALSLSACAVGPDYQAPSMTLAETYLNAEHSEQATQDLWWQSLGDETLNQLVAQLQQQNIHLKTAAERIQMANAYQTIVESFKVPTVNVGAGYYNYQFSKNDSALGPILNPLGQSVPGLDNIAPGLGSMTLMDNQHDGFALGANLSWELDLFGRIDKQSEAAKIRVEQAEIYREGLNLALTADLIHNYLQYRGAHQRKQLALENIEDQKKTLKLVTSVVNSGYGSALDQSQAEAMLAATQAIIPQLEIAEQVHKHRMAILLGVPLTQIDTQLATHQDVPELQGLIPVGLPSELLTRRPDIRIAERDMAAINEELGAAMANRYPKFFITGTPGVSAGSFDDLFKSDSFGWAGSAGVSWNVFDGGRGKANVEIQESRLNNAALRYEHTVNSAIAEVDSTLFAYGRSQQNRDQIDIAMQATDRALDKAKSLYRAGLIDYIALLDAQRQHRVMQDRQVAAKLQAAQATVAVYKSLGGDWSVQ